MISIFLCDMIHSEHLYYPWICGSFAPHITICSLLSWAQLTLRHIARGLVWIVWNLTHPRRLNLFHNINSAFPCTNPLSAKSFLFRTICSTQKHCRVHEVKRKPVLFIMITFVYFTLIGLKLRLCLLCHGIIAVIMHAMNSS